MTHPWVITDEHGNCVGSFIFPDGQKRTVTLESVLWNRGNKTLLTIFVTPAWAALMLTGSRARLFSPTQPRSITRDIFADRAGNFWLATWEGVVRYDGKTFVNFTIKENLRRYHVFFSFRG